MQKCGTESDKRHQDGDAAKLNQFKDKLWELLSHVLYSWRSSEVSGVGQSGCRKVSNQWNQISFSGNLIKTGTKEKRNDFKSYSNTVMKERLPLWVCDPTSYCTKKHQWGKWSRVFPRWDILIYAVWTAVLEFALCCREVAVGTWLMEALIGRDGLFFSVAELCYDLARRVWMKEAFNLHLWLLS